MGTGRELGALVLVGALLSGAGARAQERPAAVGEVLAAAEALLERGREEQARGLLEEVAHGRERPEEERGLAYGALAELELLLADPALAWHEVALERAWSGPEVDADALSRAAAARRANHLRRAERRVDRALRLAPGVADAWLLRAELALEQEDAAAAEEPLHEAAAILAAALPAAGAGAIAPEASGRLARLAWTWARSRGAHELASELLARRRAEAPREPWAVLAEIRARLEGRRPLGSLAFARREALRAAPGFVHARPSPELRGRVEPARAERAALVVAVRACRATGLAEPLVEVASDLLCRGERRLARDLLLRALESDPLDPAPALILGNLALDPPGRAYELPCSPWGGTPGRRVALDAARVAFTRALALAPREQAAAALLGRGEPMVLWAARGLARTYELLAEDAPPRAAAALRARAREALRDALEALPSPAPEPARQWALAAKAAWVELTRLGAEEASEPPSVVQSAGRAAAAEAARSAEAAGRPLEARDAWDAAVALGPDHAANRVGRARLRFRLGDGIGCLRDWAWAVARDSTWADELFAPSVPRCVVVPPDRLLDALGPDVEAGPGAPEPLIARGFVHLHGVELGGRRVAHHAAEGARAFRRCLALVPGLRAAQLALVRIELSARARGCVVPGARSLAALERELEGLWGRQPTSSLIPALLALRIALDPTATDARRAEGRTLLARAAGHGLSRVRLLAAEPRLGALGCDGAGRAPR